MESESLSPFSRRFASSAAPGETSDYLAGVVGLDISVTKSPAADALEDTDADDADNSLLMEYLDGELAPESRRQLEDRLMAEPDLRQELAELEQSWHVLDTLDRTPIDRRLVETTMETVILSAEAAIAHREPPSKWRRLFRWASVGLPILLGLLFGAEAVRFFIHDPNLFLLLDMPIVERFEKYRLFIDNPETLVRLAEEKVFETEYPTSLSGAPHSGGETASVMKSTGATGAGENAPLSPEFSTTRPSRSELYRRYKRLKAFDSAQYNLFCRNYSQFSKLGEAAQSQYRRLNERIARSPNPGAIDRTLTAYAAWFRGLPTHEKYAISDLEHSLSMEEFVAAIRDRYARTLQDRGTAANKENRPFSEQELADFLLTGISPMERERILSLSPTLGYAEIETAYRNHLREGETGKEEQN